MSPVAVHLHAPTLRCAWGPSRRGLVDALLTDERPDATATLDTPGGPRRYGAITAALPDLSGDPWVHTRANALLAAAVHDQRDVIDTLIARHGPARVAIVLGTTASGMREGDAANRERTRDGAWPADFTYAQQELCNPARFLAHHLGVRGPAWVVSTACSSGALALVSAARLVRAGLADVVIAGGVDAATDFTLAGFGALGALSADRCNPLSGARDGLHLGEAVTLFVVSRDESPVRLSGWGVASEAHHASAPDPTGGGAAGVMRAALRGAGVSGADVDYVNLHGTATPQNDAMEARAVAEVCGLDVPTSSTKGVTGHTLGAAGALEAAIVWSTLAGELGGRLPVHHWDGQRDPDLPHVRLVAPREAAARTPRVALSNSFGFGGHVVSVALSATG